MAENTCGLTPTTDGGLTQEQLKRLGELRRELQAESDRRVDLHRRMAELRDQERVVDDRIEEFRVAIAGLVYADIIASLDEPTTGDEQIIEALAECGGNRTKAAEKLGISVRTVQRCLKRHRLDCQPVANACAKPNAVIICDGPPIEKTKAMLTRLKDAHPVLVVKEGAVVGKIGA